MQFLVIILIMLASCILYAAESVNLEWDANTEVDLAGYKVHYGTASGAYSKTINVGNRTRTKVGGLLVTNTYYFAVSAYNSAGLESAVSNEITYSFEAAADKDPETGTSNRLLLGDEYGPHGTFEQRWRGLQNRTYSILKSVDLVNWVVIEDVPSGSSGIFIWQYIRPDAGSGFFIARLKPP